MINSIYIHLPFCESICPYCAFCKQFYDSNVVNKYLDELDKEISTLYKGERIKTLYIGGGTPSSLNLEELKTLFYIIKKINFDDDIEFTFEVNPESIDEEKLKLMKDNGVNRISVGIESCNDKILKILKRNYDYEEIKKKINLIKKRGIDNINVDLMYAIPNQTINDLKDDLDLILKLPINHISTYSLMIEPNTTFFIKGLKEIDEDLDYMMYKLIIDTLRSHGFNHYEISNFSKKGYESKHNLVYWHNLPYYGFGLGSSGYLENIRYSNTKSMHNYLDGKYVVDEEKLDKMSKISYELILGFRLIDGINKQDFYEKYQCDIMDMYNIRDLIEKKDLIDDGVHIFINYDKIYVENSILINFVGEV